MPWGGFPRAGKPPWGFPRAEGGPPWERSSAGSVAAEAKLTALSPSSSSWEASCPIKAVVEPLSMP
jgi:hypothetical protein